MSWVHGKLYTLNNKHYSCAKELKTNTLSYCFDQINVKKNRSIALFRRNVGFQFFKMNYSSLELAHLQSQAMQQKEH